MTTAIVLHTTHPAQDQVKRVCPRPADETPAQRVKRLMRQAAANRLRVKEVGDGRYECPSQRKGPDGKPVTAYDVREFPGLGFLCSCAWAQGEPGRYGGHGLYCEENEIALCSHVAQTIKHIARINQEVARLARRMSDLLAAQEPLPVIRQRRALVGATVAADGEGW